MSLRLAVGRVTVLLGPSVARRRTMNRLDEATGRCADGHDADVLRLGARSVDPVDARLRTIDRARAAGPSIVLVDRLTDGLGTADRRRVLTALRAVAETGAAVLVDDIDPVAGLAVADGALRVDAHGAVMAEELAYLAS